ncbi:hypothetical protein [Corynebacterium sp. LK2522]|uniref:hypothetical protein n=1 Tax=Corynebacterium sp. LK2522 TaxID=3110474 RepID=UPI002A9414FD|nr:hypothetical protein [Corynebacterium sp.]
MTSTSFFRRVPWRTFGWALHAVVHVVICLFALPYAAAKVILLQMGGGRLPAAADYGWGEVPDGAVVDVHGL